MRRSRLITSIFLPMMSVVLISTLAIKWLSNLSVRDFHLDQTRKQLTAWATLAATASETLDNSHAAIDSLAKSLGSVSGIRFTFIDLEGTVLGDSYQNPELMENHSARPEITEAKEGAIGSSIRYSATLDKEMMYLVLPLDNRTGNQVLIRAAMPITEVDNALHSINARIAYIWFLVFLCTAGISYWISRRISRPIAEMEQTASRIAHGEFRPGIAVHGSIELTRLSNSLNTMAQKLAEQFARVTEKKNELEAVLKNMSDGVVTFDTDQNILIVNRAAERMLGITSASGTHKILAEVVRHPELLAFADNLLKGKSDLETEIKTLQSEQILRLQGVKLIDVNQNIIGGIIVFSDITRLRKLETVRRDFVANVSHELRTPVTSIRASVETLLEASPDSRDEMVRFLKMIERNANRMNSIIEDLLVLARLDQNDAERNIAFSEISLSHVLDESISNCLPLANAKGIELSVTGDKYDLMASPDLLEEAFTNLIDNAIKYSPEGSRIEVGITRDLQEITISVKDSGIGIHPDHHSRLFERFYRVDQDRSRKEGGTGLGLAIVKHIAQIHHGRVSLSSSPGRGSTFRIHLPKN